MSQRGYMMSAEIQVNGIGLKSEQRLKEEAKSEGHTSEYEDEYEGEIVRAI